MELGTWAGWASAASSVGASALALCIANRKPKAPYWAEARLNFESNKNSAIKRTQGTLKLTVRNQSPNFVIITNIEIQSCGKRYKIDEMPIEERNGNVDTFTYMLDMDSFLPAELQLDRVDKLVRTMKNETLTEWEQVSNNMIDEKKELKVYLYEYGKKKPKVIDVIR